MLLAILQIPTPHVKLKIYSIQTDKTVGLTLIMIDSDLHVPVKTEERITVSFELLTLEDSKIS